MTFFTHSESAVPAGGTPRERMRHKLRTAAGRAQYDKRNVTVEPVCGPLKELIGLRQFLLRGLENVRVSGDSAARRTTCSSYGGRAARAWSRGPKY